MTLNWGTAIAAVYTTFAVATAGFVTFAMGRSVDLVRPDYYAQSLRQNDRMSATANADALHAVVDVAADGDSIAVLLPDQPLQAAGTITLYRPSNATADRTIPLSLDAGGRQRISTAGAARGSWIVQLAWTAHGREFYLERPITLP